MKFNELNISTELKDAINEIGYENCTAIQEQAIPVILAGSDVLAKSATGTGKTAAFGIPLINSLKKSTEKKRQPQAMVLCPTRELAQQVADEFGKFTAKLNDFKIVCIFGGVPIDRQIKQLKSGADIIVGCPGRVLDHLNRHTIKVNCLEKLVLDEADEMLNMGFREDIEKIIQSYKLPRQTLLFSATMPKAIMEICDTYQTNPVHIKIKQTEQSKPDIDQVVYFCKQSDKKALVMQLIDLNNDKQSMIFCNTKKMVDDITGELIHAGYKVGAIHGDMKQEVRMKVMQRFKDKKINILVATDVAARGIDVQNMDVVYNFDYPQEDEYYIHRIGRSGRAGNKGLAITLLTNSQRRLTRVIEKITKSTIEIKPLPTEKEIIQIKKEQLINEIVAKINQPINEEVYPIIKAFIAQGYSHQEICLTLINAMYNQREIKAIKNPEAKKMKKSSSKEKTTLMIDLGKKDTIQPAHIVGAIMEVCNLKSYEIGKIKINNNFSLVDVNQDHAETIISALKNTKIKGKSFNVKKDRGAKRKERSKKKVR